MEGAEVVQREDGRGEQPAECAGQGRHDHVQRQAEGELGALVPAGEVVGNAGQHAGLEDAEEEADAADGGAGLAEGGGDGDDAEGEGGGGEEPAGADPLAEDGGGDLEEDVGDVEGGEDDVVVVAFEVEVLVEAGDSGVSFGC